MSADDIKCPLSDQDIDDIILTGSHRTAAGGIYATSVYAFAKEVAIAAILADRANRAPSPQGDGWQPIETAPKDGTRVLLATPRGRMADGEFHARYGVWSWPYVMVEPTLWRPLPTPSIDAARSTPATEKGE